MGDTTPQAHSLYGMSVMERRIACPGSAAAERDRADRGSAAADRGTLLHDVAARALQTNDPLVPFELDEPEDCQAIVQYVETVLGELKRYEQMALVGDCQKPVLHVESKFALDHMHDDLWGTVDAMILAAPYVHVFDLKTGGIMVPLIQANGRVNAQLGGYMLGGIRSAQKTGAAFDRFRMTVVQPARGGAKTIDVSRKQLALLAMDIDEAVTRGESPDAPRVTGDHCTFCKARAACPERREEALQGAQDFFNDDMLSLPAKEVVDLDDGELARLITQGENLARWLKDVRAEAWHRLDAGRAVPGLKLVAKRATRKWKDEAVAIQRLKGEGFDGTDLFIEKFKSPAQVEKLGKDLKPIVAELCEAKSSGAKLVPEDHPGDPLPRGAASVFDDETE